jgi:hypothetical protein
MRPHLAGCRLLLRVGGEGHDLSAFRKLTTAWLVQAQYLTITSCACGLVGSRLAAFHSASIAASQRWVK